MSDLGATTDVAEAEVSAQFHNDPLPQKITPKPSREAVGIFDSYDALCAAADELYRRGFNHWDVMRQARQEGARSGLSAAELVDDPGAHRTDRIRVELVHDTAGYMIGTFGVIPEIAAAWAAAASGASTVGTWLIVILIGGGGAITGAIVSAGMARLNKMRLVALAANGGLALWAYARTAELEAAAVRVLQAHDARNIHVRAAHDD